MKALKKIIKFIFILAFSYYSAYAALLFVKFKGKPLLQHIQSEMIWNRDVIELSINNFPRNKHFKIQIYGSSHTYRSFDPRIFEGAGLSCYNWGSSSQTPKNSYQIIKEYSKNTDNIILEVYPINFILTGTECSWDMIASPFPTSVAFDQCIAQKDLRCWQFFSIRPLIREMMKSKPAPIDSNFYQGYIETADSAGELSNYEKYAVNENTLSLQMEYLHKIVRYCKTNNINLILACAPIPHKLVIQNEQLWKNEIEKLCKEESVPFINLLRNHNLSDKNHFFDDDHLNRAGVSQFNRMLLDSLITQRLLK